MQFSDKIVWITGASSGIGEALAYAFNAQGAKVAITARNVKELERVKQACTHPEQILALPLDVADFDAVPQVGAQIIAHFGRLDILVNNAGISQRALVKDTNFLVDRQIMDINYLGTVAVTKAVLPTMLAQRSGQIVVISSVMGKLGTPFRSAYSASKHALHGFFDSLRAELVDDNISVTIICPGYVNTNVTINALKGDGSKNAEKAASTTAGLAPDIFATKALNAIARQKQEVNIGGKELLGIYLKRFFPGLMARLLTKINVT